MSLLARQGKREAALAQYETCRRVLAEDLGLEPSVETAELAEQIRSGALTEGEKTPLSNLAAPTTSLLGREVDLAQLASLLATTGVRLVTLVGPPGIGKTRLAQEVAARRADDYVDGACYVELAPLRDPELVLPTIAAALGVQDTGSQPVQESLHTYLREKQMLLVLDNFEHLLPAAPVVASLLGAAAQVQVLATSRAALRVAGEHEFPVPPLAVPDAHLLTDGITDPMVFAPYTALQLFVERARAIQPGFALSAANGRAVASICARLDGLPLAIELAAARTRMLPPQALLGKLSQRLKVLTGGPRERDPRQQTLRSTIEWSYDLLSDGEKQLFRRMAVFQGGRTLDALEAVCGGGVRGQGSGVSNVENLTTDHRQLTTLQIDVLEGVESLISQSLLQQREGSDGEPRFWMLETIHEYAWEKLGESGEAEALQREHALYFVRLAEEAKLPLNGPNQAQWFARFGEEHDNLRAALDWAYAGGEAGDIPALEAGLQLLCALREYWDRRGHGSEGRTHLARLLALAEQHGSSPVIRAESLNIAGVLALWHGDYSAARALLEEGLALGRAAAHDRSVARCLYDLGYVPLLEGDYAGARSLFDQSLTLYQKIGGGWGISVALMGLGIVEYSQGDYAGARTLLEQCLALQREIGDKAVYADALGLVGNVVYLQGDFAEARALHEESMVLRRELGVTNNIHLGLINLGNVTCSQGNYAEARAYFQQCLALSRELGDKRSFANSLRGLGAVAACTGQPKRAAQLLGAATEQFSAIGGVIEADDRVLYDQGIATARDQLGEAAFQRAWEEGRAMSMEEAIAYALEEAMATNPVSIQES
jgi:predicted ATPase/Tfp pilus assembly protein PilF